MMHYSSAMEVRLMKFLMQRCHGGQVLNVFPAGGRVSSLGDMALWVVAAGRVQVQFMGMVVNRNWFTFGAVQLTIS